MKGSVIITAHNEGAMLDATIRSVVLALDEVAQEFEVILHLDNATEETLETAKKYQHESRVRIFENHFGDVGPARNFAAKQAKGEFLFFIDGDDLVSREYFAKMLQVLEKNPEAVVSPEMMAEFDAEKGRGAVFRMSNSGSKEEQAFLLFSVNCWTMAIAGRKETFLKHRYIESKNGYGHEDYALNIELAAAEIPHLVAPGAVYFVRRKAMSRQKWNEAEHNTQPQSKLFEFEFWREMNMDVKPEKTGLREIYTKIQRNRLMKGVMGSAGKLAKRVLAKKSSDLPAELLTEWQKIAEIEPMANPDKLKINTLGLDGVNKCCPASEAYLMICKQFADSPDEKKTLLLVTTKQKTLNCSEDVVTVDLTKYLRELTEAQAEVLVTRLLVQAGRKSRIEAKGYGKKWLDEHKRLVEALEINK